MQEFDSGCELMRLHQHVVFDNISRRGYEIWYRIEPEEGTLFRDLHVEVRWQAQVIATADFTDDGAVAYSQNVRVDSAFHRQGIANAVYVFAEKALGKVLYNFWGGDTKQSAAAKALWANPNRPFGHRRP